MENNYKVVSKFAETVVNNLFAHLTHFLWDIILEKSFSKPYKNHQSNSTLTYFQIIRFKPRLYQNVMMKAVFFSGI